VEPPLTVENKPVQDEAGITNNQDNATVYQDSKSDKIQECLVATEAKIDEI
jgi:hypothetical protein